MAQVRIAHANLISTKEQLDIDTRVNAAYKKNLDKAVGSNKVAGELSALELAHMRLATAETEIQKYLSLGNYYVSYFRVLNTLGIENLHEATIDGLKKKLVAERLRAQEELDKIKAEYEARQEQALEAEKAMQKSAEQVQAELVADVSAKMTEKQQEAREQSSAAAQEENSVADKQEETVEASQK